MKKPKIDLSKAGLSSFFLNHIEKVILGGALLAMAFLLYNGWSTETYTKSSPKKLSDAAARAQNHITKTSWKDIEDSRSADVNDFKRIEKASERLLDPKDYNVGAITGSPTSRMSTRVDPELVAPGNLLAESVRAPILVTRSTNSNAIPEIEKLEVAVRGASGSTGRDLGLDDFTDDLDDDVRSRRRPKGKRAEVVVVEDPFGDYLPDVMVRELQGFRTKGGRTRVNGQADPVVRDFIAVKGIVNFDAQFKKYEAAFRNAVAYYPRRDRPQYIYMEVQRKTAGSEEWQDISERIIGAESRYGAESPEVIAPDYFHPVTVRPTPPLANTDIRDIARHPDIPLRKMVPDSFAKRNDGEAVRDDDGIFNNDDVQLSVPGSGRKEEMFQSEAGMMVKDGEELGMLGMDKTLYESIDLLRAPKVDTKLVRFYDLTASSGRTYQYRVRLWMNDPNDPSGFDEKDANAFNQGRQNRDQDDEMAMGIDGKFGDPKDILEDLDAFSFRMVTSSHQSPEVRNRIRAKSEELVPKFNLPNTPIGQRRQEILTQVLSRAWPTGWSEPTAPIRCGGPNADFLAGAIVQPTTLRCETFDLPREEETANLVTSIWSNAYDTAVSSLQVVGRGDLLNFPVPKAHLLHPGDGSVRVLEMTRVDSDAVVVDLMGGELLDGDFKLPVNMPGEILVLQSDGTFRLQNSYDDLKGYRHALLLEDEEAAFGEVEEENLDPRDPRSRRRGNRDEDEFFGDDDEF